MCPPPFLHPPKNQKRPSSILQFPSVWPSREFVTQLNNARHSKESILICFENCQNCPILTGRVPTNRMMNTFIIVNITPHVRVVSRINLCLSIQLFPVLQRPFSFQFGLEQNVLERRAY